MERRKKGSGQISFIDEDGRKLKWRARITNEKGKIVTRFFKTEKEAKAFLKDVNANEKKLKSIMEKGITFSEFAPVFLEEKRKSRMKERSYETLRKNVENIEKVIGKKQLHTIDSDVVQQTIFDFAEQGYSESVMKKVKIIIISVLKVAASKHFLDNIPVIDVKIPVQKTYKPEKEVKNNWLRTNELIAYEAECKRTYFPQKYTKYYGEERMVHPAGYKLLFILHTGLRLGEALALTWDDYDESSKTILVEKNVVYVNSEKVVQTPKTSSGERVLVLNKSAVEDLRILRKQFDMQTEEIKKRLEKELEQAEAQYTGIELKAEKRKIQEFYTELLQEHKYICSAVTFPYGSSGHGSTKQTHDKICKAIGLSHKVTVHGLRHTYVTHYYIRHKNDSDFDLATFSKSIGHSSIRTTMEIYTHLDMTENRYIERSYEDLKDF